MFISSYGTIILKKSFENIKMWLDGIDQNASDNVKKLLVGNKCDLTSKRAVGHAIAQVCKIYKDKINKLFSLFS